MRSVAGSIALLLCIVGICGPAAAGRMGREGREALIVAALNERKTVEMLIAFRPGNALAVRRLLEGTGGSIRYWDAGVGYARVQIATGSASRVIGSPLVQVANLDSRLALMSREADALPPPPAPKPENQPAVSARDAIPYDAMGVGAFIRRHPNWDGRGVTIAIIESGLDATVPGLRFAKTIAGRPIRKVADIISVEDPRRDGSAWVALTRLGSGRSVSIGGKTYIVPRPGHYKGGMLGPEALGAMLGAAGRDLSRNGIDSVAILADDRLQRFWIDGDGDGSFADEVAVAPFYASGQTGSLRLPRPLTYSVQVDREHDLARLNFMVRASHGNMVASAAVGSDTYRGQTLGVASGARLILVSESQRHLHSELIEAMLRSASDPRVDLISISWAAFVADNDGQSTVADVIASRAVARFGKPILAGAGNDPGWLNEIASPAVADGVLGIAGYTRARTLRANMGIIASRPEMLWPFAKGPSESGALKPDFVAPSLVLSRTPRFEPSPKARKHGYPPLGHGIGAGTSQATPIAAGALALLISAAKQNRVPYTAATLRDAMISGARPIAGYGQHEQGHGLLRVPESWRALVQRPSRPALQFETRGPVDTMMDLRRRFGPGLYEREGWRLDETRARSVWVRRRDGPARPIEFNVHLNGDPRIFRTGIARVALPRSRWVELPLVVHAAASGVHSALVELLDPTSAAPVLAVPATIVVPVPADFSNDFAAVVHLEDFSQKSIFVTVPPHTAAMTVSGRGLSGMARYDGMVSPEGVTAPKFPKVGEHYVPKIASGERFSDTITNPAPGTWEIQFSNYLFQLSSPTPSNPTRGESAEVEVGVHLTGEHPLIATQGTGNEGRETAPESQSSSSSTIPASSREQNGLISGTGFTVYDLSVPTAARHLIASVEATRPVNGDLSLYAIYCPAPRACQVERSSSSPSSMGSVALTIYDPLPGSWRLVVDVESDEQTPYRYRDLLSLGQQSAMPASAPATCAGLRDGRVSGTLRVTEARQQVEHQALLSEAVSTEEQMMDAATPKARGFPALLDFQWLEKQCS